MNTDDSVRLDVSGHIARITMGTDGALTVMTTDLMRRMRECLASLAGDETVRAVVLTGQGSAFIAGADLSFIRDATVEDMVAFARENQLLAADMRAFPRPIVAGINGHALGGGLEIALAADIRYAVHGARLGLPEVTVGLLHSTGSSHLLARTIGLGRAKELVLTGRPLPVEEALTYGLVSGLVAPDELDAQLDDTAQRIADASPTAVSWAKRIFDAGTDSGFDAALALEELGNLACFQSSERGVAVRAFFAREKPAF